MIVACLLNYEQSNPNPWALFPQGTDKDLIINEKGIGRACNEALYSAFEIARADYCLILANDIEEPENSIELRLLEFQKGAGIVTIPTHGIPPKQHRYLAGNFMISRAVYEKIGYFTTEWDDTYGPIDLNYTVRATAAGFRCINAGGTSRHLDNGDTAYGFSKQEALKKTWPIFREWERTLTKENLYYNKNGLLGKTKKTTIG